MRTFILSHFVAIVSGRRRLYIETLVDDALLVGHLLNLMTLAVLWLRPAKRQTGKIAILWQDSQKTVRTVHCLHTLGLQLCRYLLCTDAALSILLVVLFVRAILIVEYRKLLSTWQYELCWWP